MTATAADLVGFAPSEVNPSDRTTAVAVTAIMPTANRRDFIAGVVAEFLEQSHTRSELLILDDGADPVGNLIADLARGDPRVRYVRETPRRALGAKRNRLCELARGEVIVHWDDDDWHAPDRLARQLAALEASRADIVGVDEVIFLAADGSAAWDYRYAGAGPWVAGGSLCYRRDYWRRHPFPEIQVGEDTQWILAAPRDRVHVMQDNTFFVARVHSANTSRKQTRSAWWHPRGPEAVLSLITGHGTGSAAQDRGVAQMHQTVADRPTTLSVPAAPVRREPAGAQVPRLSIVVPFGGAGRLPLLKVVLCALRQAAPSAQIVVAELGDTPLAAAVARTWDADHLFLPSQGAFDKCRAINVGSQLARAAVTLWCDCDLLVGPDFLDRAVREFETRDLDFMFPFSRIDYLDAAQSSAVREGTRDPVDCAPRKSLGPLAGGAVGGMGLVRTGFLRQHGGMIGGFLGWGGEDNAWVQKVGLLGRLGVTTQADQVVHHLFHPDSGVVSRPWLDNPHYQGNLELLRRVQHTRTAEEFAAAFPRSVENPPWPANARIGLATTRGDAGMLALARRWAGELAAAFGTSAAIVEVGAGEAGAVFGGLDLAVLLASPEDRAAIAAAWPKLALIELETDPAAGPGRGVANAIRVPRTAEQARRWRHAGRDAWHLPWDVAPGASSLPPITGAISLRLAPPAASPQGAVGASPAAGTPVWTYWEGPLHPWIEACLETARLHLPTLRVLDREAFDKLWDRDRDIDLERLHVAQRADYIRAFLLMRYGGLWIDADCVVMRPLTPLLARLAQDVEVITHRERQGLYSNAFLGMRAGSPAARRFYETLCARLRSGRPLGWIALGNEPLTALMGASREPRLELPVEVVQPICWSEPHVMFRQAEDAEHDRNFAPEAWCYMLSNQHVLHAVRGRSEQITDPRSFFSYLVRTSRATAGLRAVAEPAPAGKLPANNGPTSRRARRSAPGPHRAEFTQVFSRMGEQHRSEGQESVSGPGSSLHQTAAIRRALPQLIQSLGVSSLLDAPCGDFHWMSHVALGVGDYVGVDLLAEVAESNRRMYAAPGRDFLALDILTDRLPRADLILCRDCLVHLTNVDVKRALANFVVSGAGYLLTTTFPGRSNAEIDTGGWRPLNLEASPFLLGPPLRVINEKCTESSGAFRDKSLGLWRLADVAARLASY